MASLIELEGVMLKKVEEGKIKHNMPDDYLLRVKHFIMLDALAKIMMLVEGVLVLCSVLSDSEAKSSEIARAMARYKIPQIYAFIKRFKNDDVDFWTLATLPNLEKLQKNCRLTTEEKELIHELFNDSCHALKNTLNTTIDFYEKNRFLYLKFKHGLSIVAGFKPASQQIDALSSILWVLDHCSRKLASICIEKAGLIQPEFRWFNTISILPYSKRTFRHYGSILSDLRKLVKYVVNNRILWATNCGEDYFPMEKQSTGSWAPTIYTTPNGAKIWKKCELVIPKITANTHVVNRLLNFELNLKGKAIEKVMECLSRDKVATIWYDNLQSHANTGQMAYD